jgi:hypothetical protein
VSLGVFRLKAEATGQTRCGQTAALVGKGEALQATDHFRLPVNIVANAGIGDRGLGIRNSFSNPESLIPNPDLVFVSRGIT